MTAGPDLSVRTIVLTLGGEGLLHAVRNPGALVTSHLLFYFLAAGMIATGFGYWAINHWQELSIRPKTGFGR